MIAATAHVLDEIPDPLLTETIAAAQEVVFWRTLAREQLRDRDPSRLSATICTARARQAERRVIARADRALWELETPP